MKHNNAVGPQAHSKKKGSKPWVRLVLVLLAVLLGLATATEHFAYTMNFQPALGPNLYNVYCPWAILIWFMKWGEVYPDHFILSGSIGAMVVAVLMILIVIRGIVVSRSSKANEYLHGSARWATHEDIKDAGLLSTDGVFVGAWQNDKGQIEYLRHNGPEHVLCYAPTRSGKGVGLVIPTLLSWMQSTVITDLKGELWDLTAGWRQKYAKNKVIRFEPAAEFGCACWNPLDEIRLGTQFEVGDVQNLATLIVDPDGKGLNDHWQKTAQALFVGCILHILYKSKLDGTPANMSTLDGLLADSKRPIAELWQEMITTLHVNGETHHTVARAAQDMIDRPEEEAGSVLSTAKSYLALYRDPIVAANTAKSEFKIHDLMNYETPVSLYIVTQPTDKDRLKPLVRVMLNMIIRIQASKMEFVSAERKEYSFGQKILRLLTGRSIKPTGGGRRAKGNYRWRQLLMVDEFPSLGKLDILQESLAFIAGYGMKFYGICQDKNQLTSRETGYGPDETITSNCHVQNAYPPNRQETAEHLSKLTGQTTVVKEQISTSGKRFGVLLGNVTRNIQEVQRPLLTADECMRMPGPKKNAEGLIEQAGDMLIFVAGYHPIYGKQPLYFQDEKLAARSEVEPPVESDRLRKVAEPIQLEEAI